MSCAAARRSSARFSSRGTTSSSSSRAAGSSSGRAQLVHAAPPVAPAPHDRAFAARARRPARVSRIPRAARVQAAAARRARSARSSGWPARRSALAGAAAAVLSWDLVARARWCWRRRSSTGGGSSGPTQLAAYLGLVSREDSSGARAEGLDHESREQSLSARARAGGLELSPPTGDQRGSETAATGPPPAVVAHAWKAQQRLHQRYSISRIGSSRRSPWSRWRASSVGFLWAVMQECSPVDAGGRCRLTCRYVEAACAWGSRASTPEGVMRIA